MHILLAQVSLYEKIKHHECVRFVEVQDEKTLVIILKSFDSDAMHAMPMFHEGFKVNHKVKGEDPKPKPKPKTEDKKVPKGKNTSSSGSLSKAEGQIRDIAIKIRSSGGEKTQW